MASWIVFVVFGGAGVVMAAFGSWQWWRQRELLAEARPVAAVIVRSEVCSSRSHDTDRRQLRSTSTTSHTAEVRFAYEVAGRRHESERLRPNDIHTGHASHAAAAAELAPFPVGAEVQAWVDERRPEQAFLLAEPGAGPLVFLLVGLGLVPLAWFASRLV